MDGIKKYGKAYGESSIEENIIAREIVKEILDYGITQAQILQIAYLLSLELESVEACRWAKERWTFRNWRSRCANTNKSYVRTVQRRSLLWAWPRLAAQALSFCHDVTMLRKSQRVLQGASVPRDTEA